MYKVYQNPNNKHLKAFLSALNSLNNTETHAMVQNLETLQARLNPLSSGAQELT